MRILIFEDDGSDIFDLQHFLADRDHRVTGVFRSPPDAIKSVSVEKPDIAVVLSRPNGSDAAISFMYGLSRLGIPSLLLNGEHHNAARNPQGVSPWENSDILEALDRYEAKLRTPSDGQDEEPQ